MRESDFPGIFEAPSVLFHPAHPRILSAFFSSTLARYAGEESNSHLGLLADRLSKIVCGIWHELKRLMGAHNGACLLYTDLYLPLSYLAAFSCAAVLLHIFFRGLIIVVPKLDPNTPISLS